MALQYVGGKTGTVAGSTSSGAGFALNSGLTGGIASAVAAGDLVIIAAGIGTAGRDPPVVIFDPSSNPYTYIGSAVRSDFTLDVNMRCAYKFMPATPDVNAFVQYSGNGADALVWAVEVWRGVDATTPLDVAAQTATGTGTGRPDPPAITPATAGAVVVVAGCAVAATGADFVNSDLTNFATVNSGDTNDCTVGMGWFAWTSGAFNPAAWTGGSTNGNNAWAAFSIALRPASTTHALTATGVATGAPSVGSPAITQKHGLTATGVATGATKVGSPALAQKHALTATGIATGAPTVGSPALTIASDGFIFLNVAGQSNARSQGTEGVAPPSKYEGMTDVYVWNGDEFVAYDPGTPILSGDPDGCWGSEAGFAYKARAAGETRPIFILKYGVPGTSMAADWGVGLGEWVTWTDGRALFIDLLAAEPTEEIVLWNQGESDANATDAPNYDDALDDFMTAFRALDAVAAAATFIIERIRPVEGAAGVTMSGEYIVRTSQEESRAGVRIVSLDFDPTNFSNVHPGSSWVEAKGEACWDAYFTDANIGADDSVPTAPAFTDQTGVAVSTVITHAYVVPAGFNRGAAISITGGEYRVRNSDDTVWQDWTSAAGTIHPFQEIALRQTSSGSGGALTTCTVTIGGVASAWNVTTTSIGSHALTAIGIATGAPSVGAPALAQRQALTATGVATGAPRTGTPALAQKHALTAIGIATGAPTTGSPAMGVRRNLTATGVATGAPTTGAPGLAQRHVLTATSIQTGAPKVGSPLVVLGFAMIPNSIATGSPTTGAPALKQRHALVATGVVAGPPTTGAPALVSAGHLIANSIATGPPTVGAPALHERHALVAAGIATGAPTTGAPGLAQRHVLAAPSIATGAPTAGLPALGQEHALIAIGVDAGAPTVGSPLLNRVILPPSPDRTIRIGAESRIVAISADGRRSVTIAAGIRRAVTIAATRRAVTIAAQSRRVQA